MYITEREICSDHRQVMRQIRYSVEYIWQNLPNRRSVTATWSKETKATDIASYPALHYPVSGLAIHCLSPLRRFKPKKEWRR